MLWLSDQVEPATNFDLRLRIPNMSLAWYTCIAGGTRVCIFEVEGLLQKLCSIKRENLKRYDTIGFWEEVTIVILKTGFVY